MNNDIPDMNDTVDVTYRCPDCGCIEPQVLMQNRHPAKYIKPFTQYLVTCGPCQARYQKEMDDNFPDWRDA